MKTLDRIGYHVLKFVNKGLFKLIQFIKKNE